MKGRIPLNIKIDQLLKDVRGTGGKPLRIDSKQRLKEGMEYFLSVLTFNEQDNGGWVNGYRILNNELLERIIGSRIPTQIRKILEKNEIIDILPYINTKRSTGYRLTQKYCTGKYKIVDYSEEISRKIRLYQNHEQKDDFNGIEVDINNNDTPEYPYLIEQFENNELNVRVHDSLQQLRDLLYQLLDKTLRKRRFRTETCVTLLNLIGSYKLILEDIKNRNYQPNLSPSNHRFNSIITGLKRELRPFLRVNGEPLVEVDLKSSQPFILSTLFNEDFSTYTDNGYNVHTIYPDLFQYFQNLRNFNLSEQTPNSKYILGVHFSPEELNNLERFVSYDFSNDFYEYIIQESDINIMGNKTRDDVKKVIMNYLFDRNELNRMTNPIIKQLGVLFPELSEFIIKFLKKKKKTRYT